MQQRYEAAYDSKPILFCGHSAWDERFGMTVVPKDTQLYMYAPLGAALSQEVVRALAAGEALRSGDLHFRRVSPLTLFNLGYEDKAEEERYGAAGTGGGAGDEVSPSTGKYALKILVDYPLCLEAGSTIPNFRMATPGSARLESGADSKLSILNIAEGIFLSELLERHQGRTCHFGGCSWVKSDFDARNIVSLANPALASKYKDPELSEDEKRALRAKRFGLL